MVGRDGGDDADDGDDEHAARETHPPLVERGWARTL